MLCKGLSYSHTNHQPGKGTHWASNSRLGSKGNQGTRNGRTGTGITG